MDQLERDRQAVITLCGDKKRERGSLNILIRGKEREVEGYRNKSIDSQSVLTLKGRELTQNPDYDNKLATYLSSRDTMRYDREKETYTARCSKLSEAGETTFQEPLTVRIGYIRTYPNRDFPVNARDNAVYDRLLSALKCDNLEEYKQKTMEQAESTVKHLRDDLVYRIRSAIRKALIHRDELNRIISCLDFGKDRYQFIVGRSKGPDGRFYGMFMDDSLDINPADLNYSYEDQIDLFTIEYEKQHGNLVNELISILIPSEDAVPDQMDEAWRNMGKYSDYRTYLSFNMQQLTQSQDEVTKIRLNKMIKRNSDGEGQDPLCVAFLISLAQAYHINLPSKMEHNLTIRLVVLDETLSRMNGRRVASCIELIRGLGFQAIVSAANDKIQNYVENMDKAFVSANPNKKFVSIQEFERERFVELMQDEEDRNEFTGT